MKTRITLLTAAAILACTISAQAETAEEAVMFMVFGVRDKDVAIGAHFEKTSDTPLTLKFQSTRTGTMFTLMSLSVTKEDNCRYVVAMEPNKSAQLPMPAGKLRLDLSGLQRVTFKGTGKAEMAGAAIQCIETQNQCADFPKSSPNPLWEPHFGPIAPGDDYTDIITRHQQALDDTLQAFKADICKAR